MLVLGSMSVGSYADEFAHRHAAQHGAPIYC